MRDVDRETLSAIKELGSIKLENLSGAEEPYDNYDLEDESIQDGRYHDGKRSKWKGDTLYGD